MLRIKIGQRQHIHWLFIDEVSNIKISVSIDHKPLDQTVWFGLGYVHVAFIISTQDNRKFNVLSIFFEANRQLIWFRCKSLIDWGYHLPCKNREYYSIET